MKPILFNTEMVRAILDGRKTVTRRVAFRQNDLREFRTKEFPEGWWFRGRVYKAWDDVLYDLKKSKYSCRFKLGDILYVRETWAVWSRAEGTAPEIHYKADGESLQGVKWRPSIHMPREAARLFLRVKSVKVERLQEISGQGLIEEGLFSIEEFRVGMIRDKFSEFEQLWDSTIKKTDIPIYGWNANPWVWVIEFERISREEAAE